MKVSCIMPTAGRRRFVPKAIACFLAQDYEDRELVIFDEGAPDDSIRDLIPRDPRIRYYGRRPGIPERSIGDLRNTCCDLASGDLIAHWDDDDYSAPGRLTEQVALYNARGPLDVVGYSRMLFLDERDSKLWLYSADYDGYAIGTSFLYARSFWHARHFESMDVGEDNKFIEGQRIVTAPADASLMLVARVHSQSTAPKPFAGDQWSAVPDPARIDQVKALFQ